LLPRLSCRTSASRSIWHCCSSMISTRYPQAMTIAPRDLLASKKVLVTLSARSRASLVASILFSIMVVIGSSSVSEAMEALQRACLHRPGVSAEATTTPAVQIAPGYPHGPGANTSLYRKWLLALIDRRQVVIAGKGIQWQNHHAAVAVT